ncbi:MAG: ubiquinol-cytochrome c reductase iron-sulfur subunit [Candidatus Omnitrophica bacterium]|nr:ubiquinol-cytochrome c reductase iron-sulfur subunit [Candidatus Omnitrophota bacterium]
MTDPIEKRLKDQYRQVPKWAEDFPLDQNRDTHVSRRDFIRYLSLVSLGFFAGTAGVWVKSWVKSQQIHHYAPMKIVDQEDLQIGEAYVFEIPHLREPAILLRLGPEEFVAFGQKCTHLQCPVIWKKTEKILFCPCHKGAFDGTTGNVLYGPPERALPKLKIELRSDGVYFVGMERGDLV